MAAVCSPRCSCGCRRLPLPPPPLTPWRSERNCFPIIGTLHPLAPSLQGRENGGAVLGLVYWRCLAPRKVERKTSIGFELINLVDIWNGSSKSAQCRGLVLLNFTSKSRLDLLLSPSIVLLTIKPWHSIWLHGRCNGRGGILKLWLRNLTMRRWDVAQVKGVVYSVIRRFL